SSAPASTWMPTKVPLPRTTSSGVEVRKRNFKTYGSVCPHRRRGAETDAGISSSQQFQVTRDRLDAPMEVRQMEFLIGRMQVVVRQAEPHHDAGNAEIPVEHADDRDRPARPNVHRL